MVDLIFGSSHCNGKGRAEWGSLAYHSAPK